jgi:hypothetical protein
MQNILTFGELILSTYMLVGILGFKDLKDSLLAFWGIATFLVTIWGYILSTTGYLGSLTAWFEIGLFSLVVIGTITYNNKKSFHFEKFSLRQWILQESDLYTSFTKNILFLLLFFSLSVAFINLYLVFKVAPHNWDSMTSHLPRMAQYIQQGSLKEFASDNWAQVTQPKGATVLFVYTFLVSGRNENLTQIVQYCSLWVVILAVYGISRKLGWGRTESFFSAMLSSLLISNIAQANTNLNDMIISSYFGLAVYFLFRFREVHSYRHLAFSAIGLGLAVGVKASSFSVIPSFSIIVLLTTWKNGGFSGLKNFLIFQAFFIIASFIVVLPSGYIDNYFAFGNVLSDQNAENIHTFSGVSPKNILKGGSYNILRYSMDFLSFDGFPPSAKIVSISQHILRFVPIKTLALLGINLEDPIAINFFPFENNRIMSASEVRSYWGIFGFCFVWISVIWFLFRLKQSPDRFFMALAAIIFLIALSFSGPYDSSRGRYFSICGIFAVPLTGIWINTKHRIGKIYLIMVVLLGGISSISAVVLKTTPLSSNYPDKVNKNILSLDRIGQLTYNNFSYYRPMVEFEKHVPANAKVAIYLFPNTFEYPLYGEKISREIDSINSFYQGVLPIPESAQYLLYNKGYPCPLLDDIHLGKDWFLRKLDNDNRDCHP